MAPRRLPRIEWRRAPDFAEVAEALHVTTRQVMAVARQGELFLALYTPDEDETLYSIMLRRDGDGVLYRATQPLERPGLWEQIKREAGLL